MTYRNEYIKMNCWFLVLLIFNAILCFEALQTDLNYETIKQNRLSRSIPAYERLTSKTAMKREIDPDAIIFPKDDDDEDKFSLQSTYTKQEISCFTNNHVFFNNSCQELLKRGVCGDKQWLVVDLQLAKQNPPKFSPICQNRLCNPTEFYWPEDKKCYNYSGTESNRFCPLGNIITEDIFGLGICDCATSPVYGKLNDGSCYELYRQGPCKPGFLFALKDPSNTECIVNQCHNKSLVYYNVTGKCHPLDEQGPCHDNYKFAVSQVTKRPECVNNLVTLTITAPPQNCYTDHNKRCIPSDKIEKPGDRYIQSLLLAAKRRNS